MTPEAARTGRSLIGAMLFFLFAVFGAIWVIEDATPLLTAPRPDLRVPFGLAGAIIGVAAAKWMVGLPYIRGRAMRWVFFVLLPLYLAFGLAGASERVYERYSFRNGASAPQLVDARVLEKSRVPARRGRGEHFMATVQSPFGRHRRDLEIDKALFDRIDPSRHCLALLTERAPNGAVRMIADPTGMDRLRACAPPAHLATAAPGLSF